MEPAEIRLQGGVGVPVLQGAEGPAAVDAMVMEEDGNEDERDGGERDRRMDPFPWPGPLVQKDPSRGERNQRQKVWTASASESAGQAGPEGSNPPRRCADQEVEA